jgi:hypothetical protein
MGKIEVTDLPLDLGGSVGRGLTLGCLLGLGSEASVGSGLTLGLPRFAFGVETGASGLMVKRSGEEENEARRDGMEREAVRVSESNIWK